MDIPTEADWRSELWDLEIPLAYRNFYGKNLEEAFGLFVQGASVYQEDIVYMPLPCFRYYVLAYTNYLLSDASQGDSDGASCFFSMVEARRDDIRSSSAELIGQITLTLQKLNDHQEWYLADAKSYGTFAARAALCLRLISSEG